MPTTAITGAASGIGAALAKQLRETGHTVIGIDREGSDISADLATVGGRENAIREVLEASNGELDHLVLCAGVGITAPNSGLIVAVNFLVSASCWMVLVMRWPKERGHQLSWWAR